MAGRGGKTPIKELWLNAFERLERLNASIQKTAAEPLASLPARRDENSAQVQLIELNILRKLYNYSHYSIVMRASHIDLDLLVFREFLTVHQEVLEVEYRRMFGTILTEVRDYFKDLPAALNNDFEILGTKESVETDRYLDRIEEIFEAAYSFCRTCRYALQLVNFERS